VDISSAARGGAHRGRGTRFRRPGPRYSGALTTLAARALPVVQHLAGL